MRADVSAVAKTLIFTVFVPGTVAGYVPWRLRQDAAPVTGAEEWAAITIIAMGIAIYLHTAFWGFALIGSGTPAPIAPTRILVVKGLHRFVRNPMYMGVGLVIGGQALSSSGKNTIAIARRCRAGFRSSDSRLRQ